jgi:fructose-1,6-bisphosphatase/inositol monophosphatase family enzyme
MAPTKATKFTTEALCEVGERAIRKSIKLLNRGFGEDLRSRYLRHVTSENTGKPSLFADLDVEKEFESDLKTKHQKRFHDIQFFGEESFRGKPIDLTNEHRTCVLVDALDGSDLYEREMGNWCSAAIFFTPTNPKGERIRAAIVGLPDETIYMASDDEKEVIVKSPHGGIERTLRGMSRIRRLDDASICFYGQKLDNFLRTANLAGWTSLLPSGAGGRKSKLTPRLYNLAGIPMIIKLIDKPSEDGSGIDLVLELLGQQAHDVVPGAFIAKKAGATVVDFAGTEITFEHLEEVILKPNSNTLNYMIASTPELARAAVRRLGEPASTPARSKRPV